jgi:hypothetical protein
MDWLRIKLIKSKLMEIKVRSILMIKVILQVTVVTFLHQEIRIIPQDYQTTPK